MTFVRSLARRASNFPPVIAITAGADSDNTQGTSEAALADLRWVP